MSTYTLDIETDSLNPSVIWCVVIRKLNTGQVKVITSKEAMHSFNEDDVIVTHNGVDYDIPILNKLWGTDIKIDQVCDTLIMSRLFNPNRENGHSLGAWGRRLAFDKIEFDSFGGLSD